jgi:hypothetical protein
VILRINSDLFPPQADLPDWIFVLKRAVVAFGVLTAVSMIAFGLLGYNGL